MSLLRILLLTELALILVQVVIGFCGDPWLSSELQKQAFDAPERFTGLHPLLLGTYGLITLIVYTVSWIFLWISNRLGKFLYFISLILAAPLLLIMSFDIVSGPVMLLDWISGGVTGAILTLLFLPTSKNTNTVEQDAAANP